jgi:sulfatase modifying factor 1
MMNGQGNGDTETGAYTLNGATSGIITANIGAQIYIPTEDEWYKAAYYNGANATYSAYPNGQNTISTLDANYFSWGQSTDVGSFFNASSFYGTFDQGGNVWEWTDTVKYSVSRVVRGGGWDDNVYYGDYARTLRSESSIALEPNTNNYEGVLGFRLAAIPEPSSVFLSIFASGMMLIRRKR